MGKDTSVIFSNTNTFKAESPPVIDEGIKEISNCNLNESAAVQLEPSQTATAYFCDYNVDFEVTFPEKEGMNNFF